MAGVPTRLGKYELLAPLAVGGMARIYIARTTGIGSFERHVVLKLITPERANDHVTVQMFLDEARLVASLNHQNVAQVFEVGEEGGIHYLAMEYVHGQDLRALLAKAGNLGTRIPLELALTAVAGAAAGLHHAHERRGPDGVPLDIVHRDVSPSNIMIGYDGAVKLLDFGIAKAAARSVETQSGIIKGKFAYMSPEQCRGRDVDRRSDVFSLGIILYEISTQHRAFRADSDFDTMHRIVTGDVVRPSRLVQSYPPALEAIVMRALSLDPAQRYPSAGHLLEAIETFAMAARMSLSTMALGRFMRDLFGDIVEPWLGAATPPPVAAKESTISSTAESQAADDGDADAGDPSDAVETRVLTPETLGALAPTTSAAERSGEARSDIGSVHGVPDDQRDWRGFAPARVPDSAQPTRRLSAVAIDELVATPPSGVASAPSVPQSATGPRLPASYSGGVPIAGPSAPTAQGLGPSVPMAAATRPSAPAMVLPPSTRHGYASGAGSTLPGGGAITGSELSYPRYDARARAGDEEMPTHASKRVLYVGAGLLAVGLFVVIAIVFGGGGKDTRDDGLTTPAPPANPNNHVTPPVSPPPAPSAPSANAVGSANTPAPQDDYVIVHIASDPKGADVVISGVKYGVTPFDGKVRRGSSTVPLVVHADGYADFLATLELSQGYRNDAIQLLKLDVAASASASSTAPAPAKQQHHKPRTQPTAAKKCQPRGQQNPFETCSGKPCPICEDEGITEPSP